jgi:hypothetical protein
LFKLRIPQNNAFRLESVAILCLATCEVLILSPDHENLLGADEWSFSLDIKSEAFKKEMGDRWANVTWNIKLAKRKLRYTPNFWSTVRDWSPAVDIWEKGKTKICREALNVPPKWFAARMMEDYQEPQPVLVQDGDGQTYRGLNDW